MKDYLAYLAIGIILISFFYFGYKDDFKRNPKEFKKTIIGVPVGFLSSALGLWGIPIFIKKWIKSEEK